MDVAAMTAHKATALARRVLTVISVHQTNTAKRNATSVECDCI